MDDAKLTGRLRLFGLLALLVPLFAGLQYVVREGVPRVEVRLVAQDVQTTVPVEVPVERVVERVVYVPVGSQAAVPPTEAVEPARAILPSTAEAIGETDARIGGAAPTDAPGRAPEAPAPIAVAEAPSDTPPLTGTVALAPPPPPPAAAPVISARAAPIVPVAAPPAEEPVAEEPEADAVVAEADAPEMAPDEELTVAEAEDGAVEEEAVVQFVSEEPVVREDAGSSIAMLRHELYVRQSKRAPAEVEAVEPPAEAVADEDPTPVAEEEAVGAPDIDEPAETSQAAAVEPDVEQPAEDDGPVSDAKPISSEELLAQAPTNKAEILDQGAGNQQSLGVLEHQLVARTAPASPKPADENDEAADEPEGQAVAATPEDEEPVQVAESAPAGEEADEEPVADTGAELREVARTGDEPETEGEPEQ